jgi:outer membrane lipoprotein-sorting protein
LNRLRTISTRKLLALCALTLVVVIGGTTVAFATSDDGPKPAPKPLANAVHDALSAPQVPGVSADIHFTNNLVDASSIEGSDPLMTGANGGMLRLELQAEEGGNDSQVLVEGRNFEIYDGTSETVYRGTLPEEEGQQGEKEWKVPSVDRIQKAIDRAGEHADLSGAEPSDVAGRPTYTLEASPSHDGGLLGGVQLSWDASNGVPLRGAVYAAGAADPVLQLEASEVSFEAVDASVFEISPPDEAEVVDLSPQELEGAKKGEHGDPTVAKGADAVAGAVDFPVTAPDSLAGLPRAEVSAIEIDGHTAALATYGKGLGGIAVIESAVEPGKDHAATGDEGEAEFTLPEVALSGGVKGEELDTALGSALRFQRGGVEYLLVGSVPPAAIEAAARDLG